MTYEDIINNGSLIYRSQKDDGELRALPIKAHPCKISYFIEENLTNFDELLCKLLLEETSHSIGYIELGVKLGFDIVNNPSEDCYFDEAEMNLYGAMVEEVIAWGLLRKDGDYLHLTRLGEFTIERKKKYRFFDASTSCCEFDAENSNLFTFLVNYDGSKIDNFPFTTEFGIKEEITDIQMLEYQEDLVDFIVQETNNQLVKNIQLQVDGRIHVYKAEETSYIESRIARLDVELFKFEDDYYLVFNNEGSPCHTFNTYVNLPINHSTKNRKVERALYTKLMNDKDATLTYEMLIPFEDILEIDRLIEDERLDWHDQALCSLIFSACDSDNWRTVSKCCDVDVLKDIIPQYCDNLDWGELTLRMDSDFISCTSRTYPWIRNMLFARTPVETSLVEQFLTEYDFPEGKDDGQWDWDEVIPVIGIQFIKKHIEDIPFNLTELTNQLDDEQKQLVADCPDACWDWLYISKNFSIEFLLTNISKIYNYISLPLLLDRIFTDKEFISLGIDSVELEGILKDERSNIRSIFNANAKDYIWSEDVISFLERTELISWASTTYKDGFELNPHLSWEKAFFSRYYKKVLTSKGFSHISATISDNSLIEDFPDFSWDWTKLSVNPSVYNDVVFVKRHINEVEAKSILQFCDNSLVEDYFPILELDSLMHDDMFVRTKATDSVSIEFLRTHINAYWDWGRLTQRVYQVINLKTMGNSQWIDRWDWNYLSENLSVNDIIDYAEEYADRWNWVLFLARLNHDELYERLDRFAHILKDLPNHDKEWEIITGKFSTNQLIDAIATHKEEVYSWNYRDLYSRTDFDAKEYLTKHIEDIRWDIFSSSSSVNRLFAKTGTNKTQSLWLRIYTDLINNEKYSWNYCQMSYLDNILRQPRLFLIDRDWDWEYISEKAMWISTEKNKDYYFTQLKTKLSFAKLSSRKDIGLTQSIVSKYQQYGWDWDALVNNDSILFDFDYIKNHQDKPWNWQTLSQRDDVDFSIIEELKEKSWDWFVLSSKSSFIPSVNILDYVMVRGGALDWSAISVNPQLKSETIDKYQQQIEWNSFIRENPQFTSIATVDFIKKHSDKISWDLYNNRIGTKITCEMVEAFADHLDWRNVSKSQDILFTISFVRKYEDKWYWSELNDNLKVLSDIPNFKEEFAEHSKVATFVDRLKNVTRHPYIYHFTHMYNAVEVIRSRKILSRDRAEELGLLKYDSAGSVVTRSNLAHPYARFYFRPCTPTQYYNEALGADSRLGYYNKRGEWKSKYPKAIGLGLPKCPIPIFFRFDLEEVLALIPERCYYSDRNMQSNNPHVYKIIDEPSQLGLDYLYSTMEDAFRVAISSGEYSRTIHLNEIDKIMHYSQQEFLVRGELDFSKLASFDIICYDDEYAELLKCMLGDDPICSKITTSCNEQIFERENRHLSLTTYEDHNTLKSSFLDEHYYKIQGNNLSDVNFDFSEASVIDDNQSEIRVSGVIKWEKSNTSFNIFFVDPKARTKEWLVYKNI